jgi:hypothetical protein
MIPVQPAVTPSNITRGASTAGTTKREPRLAFQLAKFKVHHASMQIAARQTYLRLRAVCLRLRATARKIV